MFEVRRIYDFGDRFGILVELDHSNNKKYEFCILNTLLLMEAKPLVQIKNISIVTSE